jgi:3-hydroxy-9,10-secoandrosta-1,3,5(10)-triene-9,17-dione monooxygenase
MATPNPKRPDHLPTRTEIVRTAHDLRPRLQARAEQAEDLARLPDETIADLKQAGIHKLFTPMRYGGFEMDWGAHVDVSRELGKACGSTAWVSSVVLSHTWMLARFPAEAQEEFWPEHPDAIIATAFAGGGQITPTDGGFLINGHWKFSSGVDHADCALVGAQLDNDAAPPGEHRNFRMAMLMPRQYEILDTWQAEGLKGTGSKDIRVVNQFVPAHRTILSAELATNPPGAALHPSYIYGVEMMPYFVTLLIGPILGTAHGAMLEYCELTRARVGQMFGETIADQIPVQVRIGESYAELEAADLLVERLLKRLHQAGCAGQQLTGMARLDNRRDLAYAARLCQSACNRLSGMMGVTGQNGRNPVQRHFRDNRTMSTHGALQWDACMATTGKFMLGRETGDPKADLAMATG